MLRFPKNQRGSILLVIMVLLIVAGCLGSMASIILLDRTSEAQTERFLQETLNEESIFEIIYFEVASKLDKKLFEVGNNPILSSSEVDEIENNIEEHLRSDFAEHYGKQGELVEFKLQEENFKIYDFCSNINTCTFDLHFEVISSYFTEPMVITFNSIQWENLRDYNSPLYEISMLHSKWRFEMRE